MKSGGQRADSFYKSYVKPEQLTLEQLEPEPVKPVKVYCTSCWTDRNITHNGKCPACGTQFPRPAHWNKTIQKLKLVIEHDGCIPIEIKGSVYFLPEQYMIRYRRLNLNDFRAVGNFMHDIKEKCESHKV